MPLNLEIEYDLLEKENSNFTVNGHKFKGAFTGLDLKIRAKDFGRVTLYGVSTKDTIKVNGRLFLTLGDQFEMYELIKVK